jgi:hypothetical protein
MEINHLYFEAISSILSGIFGIGMAVAGFLGMHWRRPYYIIRQTRLLGFYLFLFLWWTFNFSSCEIQFLEVDNENISFGIAIVAVLAAVLTAFLLCVLLYVWRSKSMHRAMVYGVNRKVADAMAHALAIQGSPYEQGSVYFRLTGLSASIYIKFLNALGFAEFTIDPKEAWLVLEKTVLTMKEHDKGHADYFSLWSMILLAVFGLLLSGSSIFFASFYLRIAGI